MSLQKKSGPEDFSRDLRIHCAKFIHSLEKYEASSDMSERTHLKGVMDEEMSQIRSAAMEITHSGVHKQEAKVEKEYKEYMTAHLEDAYSALYHDLVTLQDFTQTYVNPKFGEDGGEKIPRF